MRRLALLGGLWFLLCAAAPRPHLDPPHPGLGQPFSASYRLPGPGWDLVGLPPLTPLELLAPPRRNGVELRLYLVAMRPGALTLPPLPFAGPNDGRLETAPRQLQVDDDLPADATPAPLRPLPSRPEDRTYRPWWLLGLLLFLLPPTWRRLRPRRPSPPAAADPDEVLLAELQRRLAALPATGVRERLQEDLLRLRFAPGPRPPQQVADLAAALVQLAEEERQ